MKAQTIFVAIAVLGVAAVLSALSTFLLWAPDVLAEEVASVAVGTLDPSVFKYAFITATISTGISSIAAAYTVARVATAAIGALTEKPELFGRIVILVGLAEGIAIYGVIVSVLILNRLG